MLDAQNLNWEVVENLVVVADAGPERGARA